MAYRSIFVLAICLLILQFPAKSAQLPTFVLQGSHHAEISAVAFSPDNEMLLSASRDGVVILWHLSSGRVVRRFTVEGGNVLAIAFVRGGRVLFGVQGRARQDIRVSEKAIEVWDVATGRRLSQFGPESQMVRTVAFSADGRHAVTTTESGAILWDTSNGQPISKFPSSERPDLEELSVGPGGKRVASGGADVSVTVWDSKTGHPINKFGKFTNQIFALAMSPDGEQVIAGWNTKPLVSGFSGSQEVVAVWNVKTAKELARFETGEASVSQIAVSPKGDYLLIGSVDGTFKMYELSSRKLLWQLDSFPHTFNKATFSPDGKRIAIGAMYQLTVVDARDGKDVEELSGRSDETTSATFTSSGLLITGNRDNTASVWDLATGAVSRRFKGHSATHYDTGVTGVSVSADGRVLATSGVDATAIIWDVEQGNQIRRLVGHKDGISSIVISKDGHRVLTGSKDKTAKLWDSSTGKEICTCTGNAGTVDVVAFAVNESEIVTGGSDGNLKVFNASKCGYLRDVVPASTTGNYQINENLEKDNYVRSYAQTRSAIKSLSVFPDGSQVLVGTWMSSTEIVNLDSGTAAVPVPRYLPSASGVAVVDGGTVLATGGGDSLVHLWDSKTGEEIRSLRGHTEPITSIAVRAEGNLLAATSTDGTTIIWNYSTGQKLAILTSTTDSGWTVESGGDGRFDTSDFENMPSSWVFSDDPLRPLPPEIFMREYYEPSLLPRLLEEKGLPKVRLLASLNRVQPIVEIEKVEWQDANEGIARVRVKVRGNKGMFPRGGRQVEVSTGVYDLRVFRDGQLVGWAPKSSVEWQVNPPPTGKNAHELDLQGWREKTMVELDEVGVKHLGFSVQVPRRTGIKQVNFKAYAFNEDRVKSVTAAKALAVTEAVKPRSGKAYIVSVGVNRTESSPNWDLQYAANDARQMSVVLGDKLEDTKQFAQVVRIRLVSGEMGKKQPEEGAATKVHVQTVLDVLAGRRKVDQQLRKEIPGAEGLEKAQPEDLVLLGFSSHGFTDPRGVFHMVLADIGKNQRKDRITRELEKRTLSSDELSSWLREVDAGELVMIVDTCHSEATVAYDGFKPGPMGSRGLGQLAYDKGMRILAASKSGQSAIELGGDIKEGLLSYALVHEGLEEGKAAKNGKITMSGWLAYGAREVPNLFSSGKAKGPNGEKPTVGNTRDIIYLGPDQAPPGYQQPVLFDFARDRDVILVQ